MYVFAFFLLFAFGLRGVRTCFQRAFTLPHLLPHSAGVDLPQSSYDDLR
jgi:hypothetical protein